MFFDIFLFILGFLVLIKGADILIDGASSLAQKFGVSAFFIGLTVVAFGTSAPELFISALAGFRGNVGIALGNIIGSNISNTLLILGATALVSPLLVKKHTVNKEIPFSLLAILAVGVLVNDSFIDNSSFNVATRIDGIILILFFSIFIYYTFGITGKKKGALQKKVEEIGEEKVEEYSNSVSVLMILGGLFGLALGSEWIVGGASDLALYFGLDEALVGLTIVALGTSLPELTASLVAAKKGNADMAIGNVVGSNIFNLLWVLGISAVIRPIYYDVNMNIDLIFLTLSTILLIFLIYFGKKNILARKEGMILLTLYIFYIYFLIFKEAIL